MYEGIFHNVPQCLFYCSAAANAHMQFGRSAGISV